MKIYYYQQKNMNMSITRFSYIEYYIK